MKFVLVPALLTSCSFINGNYVSDPSKPQPGPSCLGVLAQIDSLLALLGFGVTTFAVVRAGTAHTHQIAPIAGLGVIGLIGGAIFTVSAIAGYRGYARCQKFDRNFPRR